MDYRAIPCDSNRIREFLDSPDIEDEASSQLARHLEQCVKCREEIESQAGGPWWKGVRPLIRGTGSEDSERIVPTQETDLGFLSPADNADHIGRFGPYQVLGVLGKGGMGVVLKAWEPTLRRTVAIKVLSPILATNGASRQRFTREAQAAAAVVHPHVVAIHSIDIDKASGLPYLVMPCIAGPSLQERIDRDGSLDVLTVIRIGMQAAAGLAAAHAQGIIHRDVKPANILLENGVERVVLTDFGLARAVDDASMSQSGVIAGTPQFMSPEQARGEPADYRSDLFSLGSVLYAMCAGRPPFRASSALAVLRRVSDEQPRPIRELNPNVPPELARVIDKLLAKEPAKRHQTATEVAEVLGTLLVALQNPGQPLVAPPEPSPPAPPAAVSSNWLSSSIFKAGVIVGAVGLLVVMSGGWNWLGSQFPQDLFGRAHADDAGSGAAVACVDDGKEPEPPESTVLSLGQLLQFKSPKAVQIVFGTQGDTIVASGKTATKSYDIKNFSSVEVRGPFQLELKQGKKYAVSVTTDDNLFDHLQVEKQDNKLIIGFKGNNLRIQLNRDQPLKAEVTLPRLEGLHLHGAARASAQDFSSSAPLDLHLHGASQLKGSIKSGDVTIDAHGASKLTLAGAGKNAVIKTNGASRALMEKFAISGDKVRIEADGGSKVSLSGSAEDGTIKSSGASHLDLHALKLANANVAIRGASHASIRVTDKLDYTVSSASHLDYAGDPTIGKSEKQGASRVKQAK